MTDNEKIVLDILRSFNDEIPDDMNVNLLADGFIDSFDIVNLVAALEERFNVEMEPEDIIPENFETISRMVEMMTRKE